MKIAALAIPITLVVLVPVTVLFGMSGGDETQTTAAGLDLSNVPPQYAQWVMKAGQECAAPVTSPLIAAQIEQESGWNPRAVSPVGAQGISQFMPGTWATWGQDVASPNGTAVPDGIADPFTAGDAIMSQAKYDCWLAGKVTGWLKDGTISGDPVALTLAAYNAGPDAVRSAGGVPGYPETQTYVKTIMRLMAQYTAAPSTGTGFGAQVVAAAEKWRGTPYSWGGGTTSGPSPGTAQGAGIKGFDCSSLVQYAVYKASGNTVVLPRTSQQQVKTGTAVPPGQIRPGDAIYFSIHGTNDHVGIYTGKGHMIHAPQTGEFVGDADLTDPYWTSKPQSIRRFG